MALRTTPSRRIGVLLVLVAACASGAALAPVAPRGDGGVAAAPEVRLSTDGPTIAQVVETVRAHARRVPGTDPDAPVTVVVTTELAHETGDDRAMLAGLRRGSYVWVRPDLARPEVTLVHEVAHVLTDGDGHGDRWRAVHLAAVAELFGTPTRVHEERRIAWTYDRCHLTNECVGARDAAALTRGAGHDHRRGDP